MMDRNINSIDSWMRSERPDKIMRLMRANGWLRDHAPELDRLYGIPQKPEHHPEVDVGLHIELVLEMAASLSSDPRVRYAALVHDLGKALTPAGDWPRHFKHEALGVKPGLKLGRRLGVPKEWRLLAAIVARYHLQMHRIEGQSARHLVRFLRSAGFFKRPDLLEPFCLACEADARGRAGLQNRAYPQPALLKAAFLAAQTVGEEGTELVIHDRRIKAVEAVLHVWTSKSSAFKPCA
jgi:tRNA nucleotidyltransferase (CCA-adding enzyme)